MKQLTDLGTWEIGAKLISTIKKNDHFVIIVHSDADAINYTYVLWYPISTKGNILQRCCKG